MALGAAVLAIFVANLVASLVVPYASAAMAAGPTGPDDGGRASGNNTTAPTPPPADPAIRFDSLLNEYRIDMRGTFTGVFLLFAPVGWVVEGEIFWFPWQPFVWLAAVASVPAVVRYGQGVNRWRLGVYGALIALQLSGFAAYHWSTLGN